MLWWKNSKQNHIIKYHDSSFTVFHFNYFENSHETFTSIFKKLTALIHGILSCDWNRVLWLAIVTCACIYTQILSKTSLIVDLKKLSGGLGPVEYRGFFRLYLGISDIQVPVLLNQNLRVIDSSKENLEVQLYCAGSVGWQRTEWISGDIFGPFRGKIHCYSLFTFLTLQLLESLFQQGIV